MNASSVIGSTGEPSSRAPWCEMIRCSIRVEEILGKSVDRARGITNHHHAHRDVADKVAARRIRGRLVVA